MCVFNSLSAYSVANRTKIFAASEANGPAENKIIAAKSGRIYKIVSYSIHCGAVCGVILCCGWRLYRQFVAYDDPRGRNTVSSLGPLDQV